MHTNIHEYIGLCRVKRGNMSGSELARRIGQSPQNYHNKCAHNTLKVRELEQIAEALNADLKISFVDKDTNEPII